MAAAGRKTALIKRRYIGGSCPSIACLPSKNVIYSAHFTHTAAQAAPFGLHPEEPGVDMATVRERKRSMVNGLVYLFSSKLSDVQPSPRTV